MVHRKVIDNYNRERSAFPIIIPISLAKFFLHVETRTGFGGKLVVAMDGGVREVYPPNNFDQKLP